MSASGFDAGMADAAASGVYFAAPGDLDALGAAARDAGLVVRRVDLHDCRDRRTVLLRFAVALDSPRGRGGNWDGLLDDLRDLAWLPAGAGHVLLLEDAGDLRAADDAILATLLSVLEDAADHWRERGVPFLAILGHAPANGA